MIPQEQNQQRLWVRFVSGDPLTQAEGQRLMSWVDDEELKDAFLDDLETDRTLRSLDALAATEERFIEETLAHFERHQSASDFGGPVASRASVRGFISRLRPIAAQLLVAAAAVFLVGVWAGNWRDAEPILLTDQPFVTAVSSQQGGRGEPTRMGPGLVEFPEGETELAFDSGAILAVEGPARLELISVDETLFLSGRVQASVPAEIPAFIVRTPTARIGETGTIYELLVQRDGDTNVRLIKGELSLEPGREGQWTGHRQRLNITALRQASVAYLFPTVENAPVVLEAEGAEGAFVGVIVADGRSLEYGGREPLREACESITEFLTESPDQFAFAWNHATANGSSAYIQFDGQALRQFRVDELNDLDHSLSLIIKTDVSSGNFFDGDPADIDFGEFTVEVRGIEFPGQKRIGIWAPNAPGEEPVGKIWINEERAFFQNTQELKALIQLRNEFLHSRALDEEDHGPTDRLHRRLFLGRAPEHLHPAPAHPSDH